MYLKELSKIEKIKEMRKKIKDLRLVVVVEGRRDREAISSLGFERIITIDGKPIFKIPDLIRPKERVLILTDFDKEGKRKAKKLKFLLTKKGVEVEEQLRKLFSKNFRIRKIEELNSLFKKVSPLL